MKQDVISFRPIKSLGSPSADKPEGAVTTKRQCKWHRCKDIFENDIDLVRHLESRHLTQIPSTGSRTIACRWEGCRIHGQTFTKAAHLHRHVLQYHGGPKPYICPRTGCGKAFGKESALAMHAAYHSRVSSPVPMSPVQKPPETPQKQRQLVHFRRFTPPMAAQADPVDAPTLLAITQWLSEGRCRSRNPVRFLKRQAKRKVEPSSSTVIATRLTKFGHEVLNAPTKSCFQSHWMPAVFKADTSPPLPSFDAPSTMISLLSVIRTAADAVQEK